MSDGPVQSIGDVDARREPEAGMALLGPDNQVRSPRKRQVIDSFRSGARKVSHARYPVRTRERSSSPRSRQDSSAWTTICRKN
jgi:hypothetical protein